MTSAEVSIEGATEAVRDLGFFSENDPIVGERVAELRRSGIRFLSADGLEFARVNILNDRRIRPVLASLLPSCGLARYRRFHSDPGHIFQFRSGGEQAGGRVLVALLWGSGSEVVYYGHSHRHALPGVMASNGLWEVPYAALESAGCGEGSPLSFEHGGLTIQDARSTFEWRNGSPIAAVFATPDILMRWSRMKVPKTPEMLQMLDHISRSTKILLHIELMAADTEERPPAATDSAATSSDIQSKQGLLEPSGSLSRTS